ncbi:MAG: hypothetical protein ACRCTQ_05505 [Brevinemataceae bacterium]
MSFKIPKKMLRPKFGIWFKLCLSGSLVLGLLFIILAVWEGVSFYSRKTVIENYNSFLSVKSQKFNLNNVKNVQTWWQEANQGLETLTGREFVRSIAKRTILPALYTYQTNSFPIRLIGVESNDPTVFPSEISSSSNQLIIPEGFVNIGEKLAQRFNLAIGSVFPIIIPSLNVVLSNRVHYIFSNQDPFLENYGVFVSHNSLTNIVGSSFTDYYVRFSAAPFASLLVTNLSSVISYQKQYQPDDKLEYQYRILNRLTSDVLTWIFCFYAVLAILVFLMYFKHQYFFSEHYSELAYRIGNVSPPRFYFGMVVGAVKFSVCVSVLALMWLMLFIRLDLPLPASFMILTEGLFPQMSFPLKTIFSAHFPMYKIGFAVFGGLLSFSAVFLLLLFFCYLIDVAALSENRSAYFVFALILFAFLSVRSSDRYFYYDAVLNGIEKFWENNYLGKYTLFHENYPHNQSIGVPSESFSIPNEVIQHLNNDNVLYLTVLETEGQAEDYNQPFIKKDIFVSGISGSYLPEFNDIIQKTGNNQVIIGKNVSEYFPENNMLLLVLENRNGIPKELTVSVTETIDFGDNILNNTIFVNPDVLAKTLEIPRDHITKLQILKSKKLSEDSFVEPLVFQPAYKYYSYWNFLNYKAKNSELVTVFFQVWVSFLLLVALCFYVSLRERRFLLYCYEWGIEFNPYKKYYFYSVIMFALGAVLSFASKIYYFFVKQSVPNLFNNLYVPVQKINFSSNPIALLWVLFIILAVSLLVYVFFIKLLSDIKRELAEYSFRDKHS